MNPTLYDILGVSQDASRDEIRTAWREAADRFEPGEGGSTKQFRLFNEAAEVLLDPERRKEYDARLAAEGRGADTSGQPEKSAAEQREKPEEPAGVVPGPPMPGTAWAAAPSAAADESDTDATDADEAATEKAADQTDGPPSRRGIPWWAVAVLGVVTAVVVGVAAYFVTQAREAEAYQEALDRAPAAAESAAVPVLSYDYESLEADRDAAAKFLTEDYRSDYLKTFDKTVLETATQIKATVEAEVLASAPMLVGEDRDPAKVSVLVFVDQATTSTKDEEPARFLNRARFDMVDVDGTWLVDNITSY